jgi:hypothetical protein
LAVGSGRSHKTAGPLPIGIVAVGGGKGGPLPADFEFDDPHADRQLHYIVK